MSTQAFSQSTASGYVETTNATATAVPGLAFTLADKEIDTFEVKTWVVRSNASEPSVGFIWMVFCVRRDPASGNYVVYSPTGGNNPTTLMSTLTDAGLAVTATISSNTIQFNVTGIAATTYEWQLVVARATWSSGP